MMVEVTGWRLTTTRPNINQIASNKHIRNVHLEGRNDCKKAIIRTNQISIGQITEGFIYLYIVCVRYRKTEKERENEVSSYCDFTHTHGRLWINSYRNYSRNNCFQLSMNLVVRNRPMTTYNNHTSITYTSFNMMIIIHDLQ